MDNFQRREWLIGCAASALGSAWLSQSFASEDDAKVVEERIKTLRTCDTLAARFHYYGEQEKPFYQVTYYLGDFDAGDNENSFNRVTRLESAAMLKLLDALAKDGFLATARDITKQEIEPTLGYSLTLIGKKAGGAEEFKRRGWQAIGEGGHVELYQPLGWDLKMIERLEALQKSLDGDAAKDMELLLGRLSGYKRKWQEAK